MPFFRSRKALLGNLRGEARVKFDARVVSHDDAVSPLTQLRAPAFVWELVVHRPERDPSKLGVVGDVARQMIRSGPANQRDPRDVPRPETFARLVSKNAIVVASCDDGTRVRIPLEHADVRIEGATLDTLPLEGTPPPELARRLDHPRARGYVVHFRETPILGDDRVTVEATVAPSARDADHVPLVAVPRHPILITETVAEPDFARHSRMRALGLAIFALLCGGLLWVTRYEDARNERRARRPRTIESSAECAAYCAKIDAMGCALRCDPHTACVVEKGRCEASTRASLQCTVDQFAGRCIPGGFVANAEPPCIIDHAAVCAAAGEPMER